MQLSEVGDKDHILCGYIRAPGFIQISVINNMEMRKKLTVCIIFLSAAGEASGLNENIYDLYL